MLPSGPKDTLNFDPGKTAIERVGEPEITISPVFNDPPKPSISAKRSERTYYGTDGHIDLFFNFIAPKECLMLTVPDSSPNAEHLAAARKILTSHGIKINLFEHMPTFEADGRTFFAPYLNYYVCNGAVLVPLAEADHDMDQQALQEIGRYWPGRAIIGIPMRAGPMQGGAIHCLTQQVPQLSA